MHLVNLITCLGAPLSCYLLHAVFQQEVAHAIVVITLNLSRKLVLAPQRLMRQILGKLEQFRLAELQVLYSHDAMERTHLVLVELTKTSSGCAAGQIFVLSLLLLLDCVHYFLCCLCDLRLKYRLKVSHECLKEGVI